MSGCATSSRSGGIESIKAKDIAALAELSTLKPHRFEGRVRLAGRAVEVTGVVEDAYRYQATVSIDGSVVYEEAVLDDRRFVRLISPDRLVPHEVFAELPLLHDSWLTLMKGEWVLDPQGAPPEFAPTGTAANDAPLRADLVSGFVRFLDAGRELAAKGMRKYDRDSVQYLRRDDKFSNDPDDGRRFDALPTPYDPTAVFTDLESLRRYFEYTSVWTTTEGVTRVERLLELPPPSRRYRDMYAQLRRAGGARLLRLIDSGPAGRVMAWSYRVENAPGSVIDAPDAAATLPLEPALAALARRLETTTTPTPLYGAIE